MFSCEFREISQNIFSAEHLQVTASDEWILYRYLDTIYNSTYHDTVIHICEINPASWLLL